MGFKCKCKALCMSAVPCSLLSVLYWPDPMQRLLHSLHSPPQRWDAIDDDDNNVDNNDDYDNDDDDDNNNDDKENFKQIKNADILLTTTDDLLFHFRQIENADTLMTMTTDLQFHFRQIKMQTYSLQLTTDYKY